MNNETQGRKEIAENVVQALLIATATGLVNLGLKAIEAQIEKQKKKNTQCN